MQIRSGRLKGRQLFYPKSGLRPTKDITRLAIFNIIARSVRGARVCDLFAGGGSLGIEALSRGATDAVFVDNNPGVVRFLKENVKGLNSVEGIKSVQVLTADAAVALNKLRDAGFDIVFADPPYRQGHVLATIDACAKLNVVRDQGLLVMEHHRLETPENPAGWELVQHGRYGDSEVTVLRRRGE